MNIQAPNMWYNFTNPIVPEISVICFVSDLNPFLIFESI